MGYKYVGITGMQVARNRLNLGPLRHAVPHCRMQGSLCAAFPPAGFGQSSSMCFCGKILRHLEDLTELRGTGGWWITASSEDSSRCHCRARGCPRASRE